MQDEVPAWLVIVVMAFTGIYFLGLYEGWWEKLKEKRKK